MEKCFQMKCGFVWTVDLWSFLGVVEVMENMVFVSWLYIVRWSWDPDYVQIKNFMVVILWYVELEEE